MTMWTCWNQMYMWRCRDFAEYVLSCAPAGDQEVLRGGVEALDDEL